MSKKKYSHKDQVVIFSIGDIKVEMPQEEYDRYIELGQTKPVLIGNTIYMVTEGDFYIIDKLQTAMENGEIKKY